MSAKKDYKKIAEAGLRNLYIQIADFYTESIKSGLEVNINILEYFDVRTESGQPDYAFSLSKSEVAISTKCDRRRATETLASSATANRKTFGPLDRPKTRNTAVRR